MSDAEEKNNKRPDKGESPPTASFTDSEKGPGGQIGPYKLLNILGEGGFAEVYLAEQQRPVKRRVALKVIKPGMDSKQVIARFEAERQALALLDHPNIAQVYDAGTTEAGRPYFVMECVKGVSLTEHCDREKLSVEERLGLFLQVCDGVQHAHQKGIIHRDIKPSNILVSIEGEHALPKIIDFGVAKAITQPLTERTLFTKQGQMIGTPEYMSPEQAGMTAQDIDTRSDIYSLGVLLYELLTGVLPFDRKTLEQAGFAEIQRIICEEDPPRPSTRLTDLGEEATKVAKSRHTEVATLAKRLHKELEWIPLKAMRKERTHRYRTASDLADDIENYLNGAPLTAGPESAVYRIKKFVRRNRAWVTGVAAVIAVLVAGIVATTIFAIGQARARDKAVEAERLAEQRRSEAVAARDEAERQAEISQAVVDSLNTALLQAMQIQSVGAQKEVHGPEALDAAWENLKAKVEGEPFIEASVRQLLGMVFMVMGLGRNEEAKQHLERAVEISEEQLAEQDVSMLPAMFSLALLHSVEGRYEEAEPWLVKALEVSRRMEGEEGRLTRQLLNILLDFIKELGSMGMAHYRAARYEEALVTLTGVDKLRRTALKDESHPGDVAYIAMSLHQLGRDQEAEAALNHLRGLFKAGKHAQEEKYLWEAEKLFAGKDSKVYPVWESIEAGKLKEASQLVEELRSLPPEEYVEIARRVQSVIKGLAIAYYNRGKRAEHRDDGYGDAISDYKAAVRVDPSYAPAFGDLAWLRATCPRAEFRDGAKAIENATKACELTDSKNHSYLNTLAAAYAESGDFDAAIKWQKEAIDLLPEDKRDKWQANYEERLKLYVSGKPYHKGILGWWKFDGNARDSSPFQHHGTQIGKPTYAAGIRGQALSLRGDGDHVLVPDGGDWLNGLDALTVCLWVKSNVTKTDKGFIIFEEADGGDNRDMRYDAASTGGAGTNLIKCGVTSDADEGPWGWPGRQQLESSDNTQTTKWQHLAMTWSSGDIVKLYINGLEDTPTWVDPGMFGVLAGWRKLLIGKGGKDIGSDKSWDGLIDDVRIYSYALSEVEIKALCFQTKATRPQPVDGADIGATPPAELRWGPGLDAVAHNVYFGTSPEKLKLLGKVEDANYANLPELERCQWYWWRVDEVKSDGSVIKGNLWSFSTGRMVGWWKLDGDATDSLGYGRDGKEIGNPTYAPGISGQALALRGDGDHVLVPDFGAYMNGLDALTVCLWVKSNVTGTDKGFIIFEDPAGFEDPSGGHDNRDMRYDAAGADGGGTNLIKCGVTSDATGGRVPGRQQLESSSNVQTTEWQHLAMTWSSRDIVKLYINGLQDTPTWVDPGMFGALAGWRKLLIGKGGKDIGVNKSWNGLIDDVRIYSYALSEAELKALYAGDGPGPGGD